MHCVDLGGSFQTYISLQILASIQPRTSPKKFESSSSREFQNQTSKFQTSYLQPRIRSASPGCNEAGDLARARIPGSEAGCATCCFVFTSATIFAESRRVRRVTPRERYPALASNKKKLNLLPLMLLLKKNFPARAARAKTVKIEVEMQALLEP